MKRAPKCMYIVWLDIENGFEVLVSVLYVDL